MARLGPGARCVGAVRAVRAVGPLVVTVLLVAAALSSCATTARITDVYTALDGNGDRKRNVFVTDSKEIHCVVEMGVGRKGATVEAIIRQVQAYDFPTDKFFETNRVVGNAEVSPPAAAGVQLLDIKLQVLDATGAGAPFETGRFVCEARLDGELEKTAIFNVDFPGCPTSTISAGTQCIGFYKNLTVCPRYGLTAGGPPNCQCDELKGWQCDP